MLGSLRTVTIGKPRQAYAISGVAHYTKLLSGLYRFELTALDDRRYEDDARERSTHSESLLKAARPNAVTVVLSEHGRLFSTSDFAAWLRGPLHANRPVDFLVGGAKGLDRQVVARADVTLSLSPLTMPHEMALVVLLEQLYRAGTILVGKAYHHE